MFSLHGVLRAECIDAANLLRTAKLNERLPVLQHDTELESKAKQFLESAFGTKYDCSTLNPPNLEQARLRYERLPRCLAVSHFQATVECLECPTNSAARRMMSMFFLVPFAAQYSTSQWTS